MGFRTASDLRLIYFLSNHFICVVSVIYHGVKFIARFDRRGEVIFCIWFLSTGRGATVAHFLFMLLMFQSVVCGSLLYWSVCSMSFIDLRFRS